GQAGQGADVVGVPGQDALAVGGAVDVALLEEGGDGPLVVRLDEVGRAGDQAGGQVARLGEPAAVDQVLDLLEGGVLLGGAGGDPEGPEAVPGQAAPRRVRVAQGPTDHVVDLVAADQAQGQHRRSSRRPVARLDQAGQRPLRVAAEDVEPEGVEVLV